MGGHEKSITKAQKLILLGGGIQCLPPTEKGLNHKKMIIFNSSKVEILLK